MKQESLVHQLSDAIAAAMRSASFCVSGSLPDIDPDMEVEGFGHLKLPLKPAAAKRLAAVCKPAPYGKGTRTLVDKKVRNSFELSPKQFTLNSLEWDDAVRATVQAAADQLGLPAGRVEPQLYKLLLYLRGGFFLPHRDSEKRDRMVGSLIVALPTRFEGGVLTVRHQGSSQRMEFKEAAAEEAPSYAAFYADCEHEVSQVTRGVRLCLAYNLVLKAPSRGRKRSGPAAKTSPADELAGSMSKWIATAKSVEPLVFALDHHYTQRGLAPDLLKGNDRVTAKLVIAAAEEAECLAYFCQVSRHTSQFADDGSWGRRWRYSSSAPEDLTLGEVYEDELYGSEWVDARGKRQKFPAIRLSAESIIASTPIDDWKPTREEYEGYTGNAGNTLDRWYHRSALCVWHRDHHFDVVTRGGVECAIELLAPMVKKLKKTPKKRLGDAREDCLRLARALIGRWPKRLSGFHPLRTDYDRTLSAFPALLAELDDPDTASALLSDAAPSDRSLDLHKLVVSLCRKHGCARFDRELTALFETNGDGIRVRDMKWLEKLATARFADPAKDALVAKLARRAAEQFCQPAPERYYYADATQDKETLFPLLHVLLIAGDDRTLKEVISFVASHPEQFSVEKVQVPVLEKIVTWRRKQHAAVPPLVAEWLRSLKQELSAATAQKPQPPADWSRPAEIECSCQYCKQLNEFLADPDAAMGRIPAREDMRSHLTSQTRKYQCDVTHKLEKKGSPYTLVFNKTNGSFERRMKRYTADQKLLKRVDGLLH